MRRRRNHPLCKEGRRTLFVRRGDLFIFKNLGAGSFQREEFRASDKETNIKKFETNPFMIVLDLQSP